MELFFILLFVYCVHLQLFLPNVTARRHLEIILCCQFDHALIIFLEATISLHFCSVGIASIIGRIREVHALYIFITWALQG